MVADNCWYWVLKSRLWLSASRDLQSNSHTTRSFEIINAFIQAIAVLAFKMLLFSFVLSWFGCAAQVVWSVLFWVFVHLGLICTDVEIFLESLKNPNPSQQLNSKIDVLILNAWHSNLMPVFFHRSKYFKYLLFSCCTSVTACSWLVVNQKFSLLRLVFFRLVWL